MGADGAQGPPGEGQGPPHRLREAPRRGRGRHGRGDKLEISIPPGHRLGDKVIEVDHLAKGYGDRLLIEDLSFSLPPAGIVGVIGPNGAGKTTLFRMLTGQEAPDGGTREASATPCSSPTSTSAATCSTPDKTVYEEITDGVDAHEGRQPRDPRPGLRRRRSTSRAPTSRRRWATCPGGERNRVHLAKVLRTGGNVLLLDEPTNDLDVDTLRALEDALDAFPGCAVVISHDRWFLDRIATHVLAFEGDC